MSDAELWDLTWREYDALSDALRQRIRRDDARSARLCQVIVGAFAGKSIPLEDFMPQQAKHTSAPANSDAALAGKLAHVMHKLGGKSDDLKPAPLRTDQEFREHMWTLMGITE